MSRSSYSKRTCRCGKRVSSAGFAWDSHMQMHLRRGHARLIAVPLKEVLLCIQLGITPPKEYKWLEKIEADGPHTEDM